MAGILGISYRQMRRWKVAGRDRFQGPHSTRCGIFTYQHSFAGKADRPAQNNFQAQPIVTYNLAQGFYLRSSAVWDFDLERGRYVVPLGLGAGKVWKPEGGTTLNLFVEPQWTVAHDGIAPQFQVLFGLFMQFPIARAESR